MTKAWGHGVMVAGILGLLLGCGDGEAVGPAPVVVQLTPASGATGVTVHAAVTASFSEPVTIEGLPEPLVLRRDGRSVAGSVSVDGGTVTFRPERALDPGTAYTATLSGAIASTGGAPLDRDTAWSFTTLGEPPPTVDTASITSHLRALAHDSMNGRGSGTEDELRAALYVRDRFAAAGLEPAIPDWLQTFELPGEAPGGVAGASSQNVLGVIPGLGALADEWVVVGAHYDHVGIQEVAPDSFAIFNGADDNASGAALLVALAETISDYVARGGTGDEARRSIMFQAYGAEELGLIGSRYYCSNPVQPLAELAGMLSFDMVGRLRLQELYVSGLWTSQEWAPVLGDHTADLQIVDKQDCQSCSDYTCFRQAERPAIWFFTGFHDQYHTPEDDVALIDAPGIARIGDLAAGTLIHLALRSTPLPFDRVTP